MRRFNGKRVEPLWVFGNDDRWQFRDPAWPWGLVGRVFNSRGESGTGALIGDRLVMTAGHMVPWGDNPWWMLFVPGYYDGVSLHGAGVQSYVSDARGYDVHGDVTGYDWAVLRLYNPLGNSLGYFGYNGYSDSWNNQPFWSIVGYPGAIANAMRPSFQGGITVDDTDGDSNGGEELESETADLTPGNSGGPMFGWWNGDPRLVGVVSGQEEIDFLWWTIEKDNVMAGGSGFTGLAAWGRSNWPL
jgi:V8-like Glu-specific endopeptidase